MRPIEVDDIFKGTKFVKLPFPVFVLRPRVLCVLSNPMHLIVLLLNAFLFLALSLILKVESCLAVID